MTQVGQGYALVLDGPADLDEAALEHDLSHAASMHRSPRMHEAPDTDAVLGSVHWAPAKSLWWFVMAGAGLIGAPLTFSWPALFVFLVLTAATICLGHSLGMHRRLIHRSFECPLWLEYFLVYCGVLVGMAGPFGIIRQHDIRDWAQRKNACHPYLAHRNPLLVDGWWQLHCALRLQHPPMLAIERRVREDRFYRFLEAAMMAQQLPLALLLYWLGGWSFVFWGIGLRVFLSLTGHWLIGWLAHNQGPRSYLVQGAGVQGYNVPKAGLVSMGEAWHNNHHAFPASARLGLHDGEIDLGWQVLLVLRRLGLVWNLNTPETLPHRAAVLRISTENPVPSEGANALEGASS